MLQKHTLKYYGVEEHDAGDILSNRSEKSNCESESKTKQMWQTVKARGIQVEGMLEFCAFLLLLLCMFVKKSRAKS